MQDVAWELRQINATFQHETTVSLQFFTDGDWWVFEGNQDPHYREHGYIISTKLPGRNPKTNKGKKFPSEEKAKELIDKIIDQHKRDRNGTTD